MTADALGGVWTYALELARVLRERGARVVLASLGSKLSPERRRQGLAVTGEAVHVHEGRLEWMHEPWEDVARAGQWLLALAREVRPDVVHLNGYAHAALPWNVPTVVVAHSCVLSWFRAVTGEPAPPEWDAYRTVVRHGLAAATIVLAPSRAMMRALEREHGRLPRTRIVKNGRAMPTHPPESGAKEPLVLCATRAWDEAKNVRTLDEAARGLTWPVYLAGDAVGPSGRGPVFEHVRRLGIVPADVLDRWYRRAAIFASPARYEPFGLAALEAALHGCALVLGDIPSAREIWGDAAVLVPVDDPAALRRAIEDLAADEQKRRVFAARARLRALPLTPSRMADRTLAAYREALQLRPAMLERPRESYAS